MHRNLYTGTMSNKTDIITPEQTKFLVDWIDHTSADLRAHLVDEAEGPITKFIDAVTDPYVLIEHGSPYYMSRGDELRAFTLVVRRADDLWVRITYEKDARWSLDRLMVFREIPVHQHTGWQVLQFTASSAQWMLTGDLDEFRLEMDTIFLRQRRKMHRAEVKHATEVVASRREALARAEEALAALKKEKVS